MNNPRTAFVAQKNRAKRRGIGWELTFEQWWGIWERSGKYSQRGSRRGQYVMARNWDAGPYAEWNVDIQLCSDNIRTVHYRKQYKRIRGEGLPVRSVFGSGAHLKDPLQLLVEMEENDEQDAA